MNILALDLGTKCGWAFSSGALNVISSGVYDLKPKSCESFGQLYRNFRFRLESPFLLYGYDLVVYEEVKYHRAIEAAHVYGALEGMLQVFCIDNGVEYKGVGVSTIQKHATGRGMALKGTKKKAMFDAAVKHFPKINIFSEDQADALWLLDYAQTHLAVR